MTKPTKAHHAGQRPTTIWMPDALAAELDRKLADAAQPGLRPSRSGFILHAIQSALGAAAAAPPAPGPTAALPAPTVQPVAPAQPVQAAEPAQPKVQLGSVLPRPESEPPLPELLVALRALFRARKMLAGTDDNAAEVYHDQTAAELAESDIMADTMYANLLDFARSGATGLTQAPFCPIVGGWEDDEDSTEKRERLLRPLMSVFADIVPTYMRSVFDDLPGPIAARKAAHEKARALARAKAEDEARRAAKRAEREAKAAAKAAAAAPAPLPPMPQQLLPEQPAPVASPFGAGPSES